MFLTETLDVKLTGFFFEGRGLLEIVVSLLLFGGILRGNCPPWRALMCFQGFWALVFIICVFIKRGAFFVSIYVYIQNLSACQR